MADKEVILLGEKLNRLLDDEDFAPVFTHIDSRLSYLADQRKAQASITDSNPAIVSHLSQRIDELESFKQWVFDSIDDGGKEKLKVQKAEDENENLSILRV